MVAPPLPPPSGFSNPFQRQQTPQISRRLPSMHFCDTGELEPGESYNPDIHNTGDTPQERCSRFYQQYRGGKKRKTHNKRNKRRKSRKNRRKTRRI